MLDIYDPASTLYPESTFPTSYTVKSYQDYYAVIFATGLGIGEIFDLDDGKAKGIITITTASEALLLLSDPVPVFKATKVTLGAVA